MGPERNEISVVEPTVHQGSDAAAVSRVRGALCLEELVAAIPDGYQPGETDWEPATGREVW